MGNNIYPARAANCCGPASQKDRRCPVSASLATIIVERIFDGVMLAFVFSNLPELARLQSVRLIGNIQTLAVWGGPYRGSAVFLLAAMFPVRRIASWLTTGRLMQPASKRAGVARRFLSVAALASKDAVMIFHLVLIRCWRPASTGSSCTPSLRGQFLYAHVDERIVNWRRPSLRRPVISAFSMRPALPC
jgi:hypothetical protein